VIQMSNIDKNYTYLIDERAQMVVEASKVQNAVSLQGLYIRSYVLRKDSTDLENLSAQQELVTQTLTAIEPLIKTKQIIEEIENIKEQQTL
ncbi:hypothetical protein, partial [Paraburkholderia sp. SIMBA_027]|uniref:hypothetical protein n=1 Tax=Paraburkholderia sp. SIMBA_027 TaxID=3085770 RepID=UPI003978566C